MTESSGRIPDRVGMPRQRHPYGKKPMLTGAQRDEIRRRFAEAREENPSISASAFARQVCTDYGATATAIRFAVS